MREEPCGTRRATMGEGLGTEQLVAGTPCVRAFPPPASAPARCGRCAGLHVITPPACLDQNAVPGYRVRRACWVGTGPTHEGGIHALPALPLDVLLPYWGPGGALRESEGRTICDPCPTTRRIWAFDDRAASSGCRPIGGTSVAFFLCKLSFLSLDASFPISPTRHPLLSVPPPPLRRNSPVKFTYHLFKMASSTELGCT